MDYQQKKQHKIEKLSIQDLITFKEIPYKYLQGNKVNLELMMNFSMDTKFQIRLCEKAYLMTHLMPLIQCDNDYISIKYGIMALSQISENQETHAKIMVAGAPFSIYNLLQKRESYEIVRFSLKTIQNLCKDIKNHEDSLWESIYQKIATVCLKFFLNNNYQEILLKLLYYLTLVTDNNHNALTMQKQILQRSFLDVIFKLLFGSENVTVKSLKLITNLVKYPDNQQMLIDIDIIQQLASCYKLFKNSKNIKIPIYIIEIYEIFLRNPIYQEKIAKRQYVQIFIEMLQSSNQSINYKASLSISHLSENIDQHDFLVKMNLLNIMAKILKEGKNINQMHRQACRFFSNITWNPKYQKVFISKGLIYILLNTLSSIDSQTQLHSVIALSNLSCCHNFHQYASEMNFKLLIHLLNSSDPNDQPLIQAAANTLANISSDFAYHEFFMKEPELTTILKIIQISDDHFLIKSILIIITNVSTNPNMIKKLKSINLLEMLYKLVQKEILDLIVYLSKAIACLCSIDSDRDNDHLIENDILGYYIRSIYRLEQEGKKQMLISLMTILFYRQDIHQEFFNQEGIPLLIYLINKQDEYMMYISIKCLVILSKNKETLEQITQKAVYKKVKNCCLEKGNRILKEGIRYFFNIFLNCRRQQPNLRPLCELINKGLRVSEDQDIVTLCLFCLMSVSENYENHKYILENDLIIRSLFELKTEYIYNNQINYATILMNLSFIKQNIKYIIKFKFITRLKEIIFSSQCEQTYCYILTFLNSIIQSIDLAEFYDQEGDIIILKILKKNIAYFYDDLLEVIGKICQKNEDYPESLMQVIPYLISYQNQDDSYKKINIQILAYFSFNPQSIPYFIEGGHQAIFQLLNKIFQNAQEFEVIIKDFTFLTINLISNKTISPFIYEIKNFSKFFDVVIKQNESDQNFMIITLFSYISKHKSVISDLLKNKLICLLFNFLENYIEDSEDENYKNTINSVLVSFFNLTLINFQLTKQLINLGIIQNLTQVIQKNDDMHALSMSYLILSNIFITQDLIDENMLDLMIILKNSLKFLKSDKTQDTMSSYYSEEQEDSNDLLQIAIFKLFYNIFNNMQSILDSQVSKDMLKIAIEQLQVKKDEQLLNIIVNIFNLLMIKYSMYHAIMNQIPDIHKNLMDLFVDKILTIKDNMELRKSILMSISIITYYEDQIKFYSLLIDANEFFNVLSMLVGQLNENEVNLFLNIICNLGYLTQFQDIILLSNQILERMSKSITKDMDQNLFKTVINLILNLSHNPESSDFICHLHHLNVISIRFYTSDDFEKVMIYNILCNQSFNKENLKHLLQSKVYLIFKFIQKMDNFDEICLKMCQNSEKNAITSKNNYKDWQITGLINFAIQENFYFYEDSPSIVEQLDIIERCSLQLQKQILMSLRNFMFNQDLKGQLKKQKMLLKVFMERVIEILQKKNQQQIEIITQIFYQIQNYNLIYDDLYDRKLFLKLYMQTYNKSKDLNAKKQILFILANITRDHKCFEDNEQFNNQIEQIYLKAIKKLQKNYLENEKKQFVIESILPIMQNAIYYGPQLVNYNYVNFKLEKFILDCLQYGDINSTQIFVQALNFVSFLCIHKKTMKFNFRIIFKYITKENQIVKKFLFEDFDLYFSVFMMNSFQSYDYDLNEFYQDQINFKNNSNKLFYFCKRKNSLNIPASNQVILQRKTSAPLLQLVQEKQIIKPNQEKTIYILNLLKYMKYLLKFKINEMNEHISHMSFDSLLNISIIFQNLSYVSSNNETIFQTKLCQLLVECLTKDHNNKREYQRHIYQGIVYINLISFLNILLCYGYLSFNYQNIDNIYCVQVALIQI